ncbi:putative NADH-ubiquinone oxidoreductase subunit B17.2 [Ascobolus immersus RN42]|uniref:NADH dehydrogenase [ubiquinone] 1 alpha subcomplex subunit n=1 Tax=Ascobolus immersus RN42 TaxID=1160509 RepID=A0A3N4IUK5_ASCIM|nr:putative NADH-ubiquinone oxidoreductase subunit B17.2 [Ascobolus immersus RN42]
MSTPTRTLKNLWKIGLREYIHQMWRIGDTKAGTLVGTDRFGNRFYENTTELPLRTRWVDYVKFDFDASQMEPGWHAWMAYNQDAAPTASVKQGGMKEISEEHFGREWIGEGMKPNMTMTRGAYRPYNTTVPKIETWLPETKARGQ